jgi:hypothetical protein
MSGENGMIHTILKEKLCTSRMIHLEKYPSKVRKKYRLSQINKT